MGLARIVLPRFYTYQNRYNREYMVNMVSFRTAKDPVFPPEKPLLSRLQMAAKKSFFLLSFSLLLFFWECRSLRLVPVLLLA